MNEIAFVTGAASGIGQAIATRLASRGATIICVDRNLQGAIETAKNIGNNSVAIECDVTDAESMASAVSSSLTQFESIDTVVANAGIAITGDVLTMQPGEFDHLFEVNVRSVFLTAHFSGEHLIRSKGTFTVIASDSGLRGAQGWPAYSASKHAVIGLVKSMALDFAPHSVRVNAVCPGWVHTPLLNNKTDESQRTMIAQGIPLGRLGVPEDVAEIVAHLSSAETRYVTGMSYVVDGGQLAGPFNPARNW